jgi:hypothetical protein
VSCAARLREHLAADLAAGTDFDDAWPAAVAAALGWARTRRDRDTWAAAFDHTRMAWEAAYLGEPAGSCDRAIEAVGRYEALRREPGRPDAGATLVA